MFCDENNDDRATSTECTVTENFGKVEVIQHSSLGTETRGVERKQPPIIPMMHGKACPDKPIPKEDDRRHLIFFRTVTCFVMKTMMIGRRQQSAQ